MLEHLIATVNAAVRMPVSFPAFTFQPWNAHSMRTLVKRLPRREKYTAIRHVEAEGNRLVLPLASRADPFWTIIGNEIAQPAITSVVMAKLGVPGDVYPRAALIRDEPGYAISIHTDSIKKAATLQIYLASDDHAPHIGCKFYGLGNGDVGKPPRPGTSVPYLPGSGYFFARTENSWHGVARTTESDGVRNSLMIVYYRDPNETGFT